VSSPARSIRTAAWLGDAFFELEIRRRIAARGDWPVARLDRVRAELSRAEAQAELLARIETELTDEEQDVVSRGRNTSVRSGGRVKRDVKAYRAATAFEALVCHWFEQGELGRQRFEDLLESAIDERLDLAFKRSEPIKRG
jgi:ribonuclease-3 family protein